MQILLDGEVVNTQLVSSESLPTKPTTRQLKKIALVRAIADNAITISQSLQVSFLMFDVTGRQIDQLDGE